MMTRYWQWQWSALLKNIKGKSKILTLTVIEGIMHYIFIIIGRANSTVVLSGPK